MDSLKIINILGDVIKTRVRNGVPFFSLDKYRDRFLDLFQSLLFHIPT